MQQYSYVSLLCNLLLTCKSALAFFMEAVPLKDTTILVLLQAIRQRVSSCISVKSSLSASWYNSMAVCRLRVVFSSLIGTGLAEGELRSAKAELVLSFDLVALSVGGTCTAQADC